MQLRKVISILINIAYKIPSFIGGCVLYFKLKKSKKFELIRPFKVKQWHDGFFYFTSVFNGEKVFIKAQLNRKDILNEVYFFNKIKEINNTGKVKINIPKIKSWSEGLISSYVAFEFLNNAIDLAKTDRDNIEYIANVISELNKNGIILRDVKESNIVMVDGLVYFIDFTFAKSVFKEDRSGYFELNKKRTLLLLGEGYKPESYTWDDMYSLCIVAKKIGCSPNEIQKLQSKIGQYQYSILSID